jgi:hypothetical protein
MAKKAQTASTIGAYVATAGIISVCFGIYENNKFAIIESQNLGNTLIITGGILLNIGIPIAISNGIKANNNIAAMRVAINQNGLSLVYKF